MFVSKRLTESGPWQLYAGCVYCDFGFLLYICKFMKS